VFRHSAGAHEALNVPAVIRPEHEEFWRISPPTESRAAL
jgi:hypothetical protein